jgi:transcriptional regulator with XRE-family HTH domain
MRDELKTLRKRALLTQFKMAALLGISQSYYSAVERGDISAKPELKKKISGILNTPEGQLFG